MYLANKEGEMSKNEVIEIFKIIDANFVAEINGALQKIGDRNNSEQISQEEKEKIKEMLRSSIRKI